MKFFIYNLLNRNRSCFNLCNSLQTNFKNNCLRTKLNLAWADQKFKILSINVAPSCVEILYLRLAETDFFFRIKLVSVAQIMHHQKRNIEVKSCLYFTST